MSSSKMKGLLKGLRYISQIFDEEKEEEMQIGHPTDVKHVAHIGGNGPAVESPSWMKEFKSSSSKFQSAPLGPLPDSKDNPEIKWVSEDSKRGHNKASTSSSQKDLPELPRSSRRRSDNTSSSNDSPRKQKSRKSRKQAKDSSDKSAQPPQEPSGLLPDIPRKSRQKKSQESNGEGGGSTKSRSSKSTNTSNATKTPHSDSEQAIDT